VERGAKLRLRRFNPAGLSRFEEFLAAAVAGAPTGLPTDIAARPDLSDELPGAPEVDPAHLGTTRLEAASYVDALLELTGVEEPQRDTALWAWLSAWCFDSVCPRDRQGRYRPGAKPRYVPVGDSRRTYRHRLLGPYLIFRAHRDDPSRALCLLSQPLLRPGHLVERFASRPRLVACPAAVGVATRLYCQPNGAIRRGAAASIERLSDVLMQLDRTYDLYGMTADALLRLLPREFDAFRRHATRPRSSPSQGAPRPSLKARGATEIDS
jgi:hypothetical protein